jgi:serine/threonine protein kinase
LDYDDFAGNWAFMSPDRFRQIRSLFESAVQLVFEERAAFLDKACQGDDQLRLEVDKLLVADEEAAFIDQPALMEPDPLRPTEHSSLAMEGLHIGPYQIRREIGRGGMGAVYLAARMDGAFQKDVAIKFMSRGFGEGDMVRYFQQERQILATLDHRNIARLLDGGTTEDGLPYLVMEYVDGQRIDHYCDEHKLNVTERLQLFEKVCEAVQYAHRNLVVHRDLKPGNILVTIEGTPKLVDFGIAKLINTGSGETNLTLPQTGTWAMTPEYASPEQLRGEQVTTATDVYSLGVVLYELLTGHRPYRITRRMLLHEVARVVCEEEPSRPSMVVGQVEQLGTPDGQAVTIHPESVSAVREGKPAKLRRRLAGDLDNVVLLALRKDPARRYSSVEQFGEDLHRHLRNQPVRAQADSVLYQVWKFIARNKAGVAAAVLILLLLCGGIIGTGSEAVIAKMERVRAETHAREAEAAKVIAENQTRTAMQERAGADRAAAEAQRERENAVRRLGQLQKLASHAARIYAFSDANTVRQVEFVKLTRDVLLSLNREIPLPPNLAHSLHTAEAAVAASNKLANDDWHVPAGWSARQEKQHEYRVSIDDEVVHQGKSSLFIRSLVREPVGTVRVFQSFTANRYRGKRVRLSGFLRSSNITGVAWLLLHVDVTPEYQDACTCDGGVHLSGTTSWQKHELVMEIPAGAHSIDLSLYVQGDGALWANGIGFEEVNPSTPLTQETGLVKSGPENLDFTKPKN